MLKRILLVFAALTFLAAPLYAQQLKIGIINMQKALNSTEEGKRELAKLQKLLSANTEELKQKEEELKKVNAELSKQGFMYSEAKQRELTENFRKLKREMERFSDDKREEFMRQQQASTVRLLKGLTELLGDYAEEQNFDLILEISQSPPGVPGVVAHYKKTLDITDTIIDLYNKKSKSGGKR